MKKMLEEEKYRKVKATAVSWHWRCLDCGKDQHTTAKPTRVMCGNCGSIFDLLPPKKRTCP
jgi:ribosomal protein S27E